MSASPRVPPHEAALDPPPGTRRALDRAGSGALARVGARRGGHQRDLGRDAGASAAADIIGAGRPCVRLAASQRLPRHRGSAAVLDLAAPDCSGPGSGRGAFRPRAAGVVEGKGETVALIRHGQPPRVERVHEGATVEGWTVTKVALGSVVLVSGGTEAELKPKAAPPTAPAPAANAKPAAAPAPPSARTRPGD